MRLVYSLYGCFTRSPYICYTKQIVYLFIFIITIFFFFMLFFIVLAVCFFFGTLCTLFI